MTSRTVCWRRLDHPGHELARLEPDGDGWRLAGAAVLVYAGAPCALRYSVDVDAEWCTRAATVQGLIGERAVDVALVADGEGRWWRDGAECASVAGCLEVDFGFSPATNLLPIRRLAPAVGASVLARAAWLGFPEFTLEPLDQRYQRTGERTYTYESAGGAFPAGLEVDADGIMMRYGDLWTIEAGRPSGPASSPLSAT